MTLTAPDRAITIRNPNKKRTLSDSQKAALLSAKNNELDEDFEDE